MVKANKAAAEQGPGKRAPQRTTRVKAPAEKPAPSAIEAEAIQLAAASVAKRKRRLLIDLEMTPEGAIGQFGPKHSDIRGFVSRLENAFGTRGQAFAISELNQIFQFVRNGKGSIDETTANAMLSIVDGVQPANELEAMLASQMAVTHRLAMELLSRAKRAEHVPQLESNGQLGVKLLRTFTMQLDALAKLRRGGEQTVRVEHVHVYPGGQAIVGNVTSGGRGPEEKEHQPHAIDNGNQNNQTREARSVTFAPGETLPSCDPQRDAVSVAIGAGETPLPNARGSAGQRRTIG